MMTCKEFEKTEKDLRVRRERMANVGGEYSKVILNDFDITLALMDNLRVSATIRAVRNTTIEKLRTYLNKIGEKIELNQKVIDNQYKQKEREILERINNEYGISLKFTSLTDLENTIATINKEIIYNPYEELYYNKMMDKLTATLRAQKKDYDESNSAVKPYRNDFDIIADGLDDVQKRCEEQNKGVKLDKGILLDIFRGDFRDQIVSMVNAGSEIYHEAYINAYGLSAEREAARQGLFSQDRKLSVSEVDIITRFLLKVTGLEEEITDSYKIKELANNKFVKTNTYNVVKTNLRALQELRSEYIKLNVIKSRKDAFLEERRMELPRSSASIEDKKLYIRRFAGENGDYIKDYDKEVVLSSQISSSLGNNDGQTHYLEGKYSYAMEDFEKIVRYYNSLVNLQSEFNKYLDDFQNPNVNATLAERNKLLYDIEVLDKELEALDKEIKNKEGRLNDILPEHRGVVTKTLARMTRNGEIKELKASLEEQREEYESYEAERHGKHNYDLANINAKLISEFTATFAPYADLLDKWGYNVNLEFALGYNIKELKDAYAEEIMGTRQAYRERVRLILNELAKQSNTDDVERMYELARDKGVDTEEPTLLVIDALQNFIAYLQNASAKDSVSSEGFLKFVEMLTEIGVEITGPDLDKIVNANIATMDASVLTLEEEVVPTIVEEPEETLETVAEETPEEPEALLVAATEEVPREPEVIDTKIDMKDAVPVEAAATEEVEEDPDMFQSLVDMLQGTDGFGTTELGEVSKALEGGVKYPDVATEDTAVLPKVEPKEEKVSDTTTIDATGIINLSMGGKDKPKLFDFDKMDDEDENLDPEHERVLFRPVVQPKVTDTQTLARKINLPSLNPNEN